MKTNRSLIMAMLLAGSTLFAARYQPVNNTTSYGNRTASTGNVYRPAGYEQVRETRRVPLDYHNNEYNKRMPTEHFTYDPEEAGLTRR